MGRQANLRQLSEIADDQGGYLTTAQAARRGVTPVALHRLVASEDLRRVRRGVYAMRGIEHPFEQAAAAWLTVDRERLPWERAREGGGVAVLSHASAASIRHLGTIVPERPALTVSHRTQPPGIEIHTRHLPPSQWERLPVGNGLILPVTTAERTIIDLLADGHEPDHVQRAVNEGAQMNPDLPELLAELVTVYPGLGRAQCAMLTRFAREAPRPAGTSRTHESRAGRADSHP